MTFSFIKKVRMGKRVEKAFVKDKGQPVGAQEVSDDDPNQTPGMVSMIQWSGLTVQAPPFVFIYIIIMN